MGAAKIPTLKPAELRDGSTFQTAAPSNVVRPEFDSNRRRLSVSERLAEGRGFWRGVFAGCSIGAVAGFSGSIAMMNVWVPQVMNVAQQAWVASSVFGGAPGQMSQEGPRVSLTGGTSATPPSNAP